MIENYGWSLETVDDTNLSVLSELYNEKKHMVSLADFLQKGGLKR